jgi:hypothetical protein
MKTIKEHLVGLSVAGKGAKKNLRSALRLRAAPLTKVFVILFYSVHSDGMSKFDGSIGSANSL